MMLNREEDKEGRREGLLFGRTPKWDEAHPSTPVIGAICEGTPELAGLKRGLVKVLPSQAEKGYRLTRRSIKSASLGLSCRVNPGLTSKLGAGGVFLHKGRLKGLKFCRLTHVMNDSVSWKVCPGSVRSCVCPGASRSIVPTKQYPPSALRSFRSWVSPSAGEE